MLPLDALVTGPKRVFARPARRCKPSAPVLTSPALGSTVAHRAFFAVARFAQGISPKHCALPGYRAGSTGDMSTSSNALLYAARGVRGFGDGFATIILPA